MAGEYSSFRSTVRCQSGGIDSPCRCVVDKQRDRRCDPGRGGLSRLAARAADAYGNALDRKGAPAVHALTPWRPGLIPRSFCPGVQAILLTGQVRYRKQLGWRDPLSIESITEPQYALHFGLESAYPLRAVMGGSAEFVRRHWRTSWTAPRSPSSRKKHCGWSRC